MSNLYRLDFADGSSVELRGESCADAAASAGEGHGRILVKVEMLPPPPKPKHILYVPAGKVHRAGLWCEAGYGFERCAGRPGYAEEQHYRRVEVDLETAILRGLNATGVEHGPTVLAAITKSIRRSIEGGA